jgi:hypothetical protein
MKDNFFGRAVSRVPVGGEVEFVNAGTDLHNAIATDGSFSTVDIVGDEAMDPGSTASLTLDQPGVFSYYCSFHGTEDGQGMFATIVVGDVPYSAAGQGEADQPVASSPTGDTVRVPQDAGTIQEGVDSANPGDLVLIDNGVYEEEVVVTTPSLVIRGVNRNKVIIDGGFERANGFQVLADGVAIENMTSRNNVLNGFFWNGVEGYRASYLTAYNNADYGIYAFDSVDGVLENSYASGSPDSGFYIGQCYPCRAVIRDVTSENNALGYSGTNAGGDLYIINSTWIRNGSGLAPNTLDSELLPPQREATIVGNLIAQNDNEAPPARPGTAPGYGNGITIAGGVGNVIERNTIIGHARHGILVTPNVDANFWYSEGNLIRDNNIIGSGRADIALAGPAGKGNCFEGNSFETSVPIGLETFGCDWAPLRFDPAQSFLGIGDLLSAPDRLPTTEEVSHNPVPDELPELPDGAEARVELATHPFEDVNLNLDEIKAPTVGFGGTFDKEVLVAGIPIAAPNVGEVLLGIYGYLLPLILLATWMTLAVWDLMRRTNLSRGRVLMWLGIVFVVPVVGVIAYYAFGRSEIPGWMRGALIGGGLAAYAIILALGSLIA